MDETKIPAEHRLLSLSNQNTVSFSLRSTPYFIPWAFKIMLTGFVTESQSVWISFWFPEEMVNGIASSWV
ncbi:MAG: hypothetical protein ACLUAR_02160 [Pilosibacter sp.]